MNIIKWAEKEFFSVLPAIIYFCVVFNVLFFVSGLTIEAGKVRYFSYFSVTIFALIVGKVMIIANSLPFINLFPHKPLIYNILWKVFIYDSLVVVVWAAERLLHLYLELGDYSLALFALQENLASPIFLSTLILLLLFFLNFVVFSEIINAVGRKKIIQLMF